MVDASSPSGLAFTYFSALLGQAGLPLAQAGDHRRRAQRTNSPEQVTHASTINSGATSTYQVPGSILTAHYGRERTGVVSKGRQSTSTSHWYSVNYPRVFVILNNSVPGVLRGEMTEYSRVPGVIRAEMTEYSRVPRVVRAEMTEYSPVPAVVRPEMTVLARTWSTST